MSALFRAAHYTLEFISVRVHRLANPTDSPLFALLGKAIQEASEELDVHSAAQSLAAYLQEMVGKPISAPVQ